MKFFKSIFSIFSFKNKNDNTVKGHRPPSDNDEREYTFIWYKKMQTGSTTHYTKPFRTKVIAKSRDEAQRKVTDFSLRKMTLVLREEKDYNLDDLNKINKQFDEVTESMNKAFEKIDKFNIYKK